MMALGFIVAGIGMLLGMPMFLAFGWQSVIHAFGYIKVPMVTVPQLMFAAVDLYVLLAIAFFMLAGFIMRDVGLSALLVDMVNTWVGHLHGGLAWVMTLTTGIFAALTGSGGAAIPAVGLVMIPRMVKAGYPRVFCVAMIAALADIGVLIPPSNSAILYGAVTDTSVAALFIAGVVPGVILMLLLGFMGSFIVWWHARRGENWGRMPPASWGERGGATLKALPVLTFPVIIIGGIYGGFFSPTEAAGVACFYALILGIAYRRMSLRTWINICREALRIKGMLFILICSVVIFARVMTYARIPHELTAWLVGLGLTKNWFIFALVIMYICIGFFASAIVIILVTVPILFPTAMAMGMDPVHFGIFITCSAIVASTTPPVGVNIFNASAIFNLPTQTLFLWVTPFNIAEAAILFMVAYIPEISLWLPRTAGLM